MQDVLEWAKPAAKKSEQKAGSTGLPKAAAGKCGSLVCCVPFQTREKLPQVMHVSRVLCSLGVCQTREKGPGEG